MRESIHANVPMMMGRSIFLPWGNMLYLNIGEVVQETQNHESVRCEQDRGQ